MHLLLRFKSDKFSLKYTSHYFPFIYVFCDLNIVLVKDHLLTSKISKEYINEEKDKACSSRVLIKCFVVLVSYRGG